VDVLRSCYDVDMSFYRDNPALLKRVRWSFVPDTTPTLPFAHPFTARNWDLKDPTWPALGEQRAPRPYYNGTPPDTPARAGLCGTVDQWQNGALSTDTPPGTWPGTEVPTCCAQPGENFVGGVAVGAKSTVMTTCCASLLPSTLHLTMTPTAGTCPCLFNLTFHMEYDPAFDEWAGVIFDCGKKWTAVAFCLGGSFFLQMEGDEVPFPNCGFIATVPDFFQCRPFLAIWNTIQFAFCNNPPTCSIGAGATWTGSMTT